jgi:hypothetical protein
MHNLETARCPVRHQVNESLRKSAGQLRDPRGAGSISEHVWNEDGQFPDALDQSVYAQTKLLRCTGPHIAIRKYPVVAAYLHRESQFSLVDAVWQGGSNVV